jgi:mRNA interferase MazF
MISKVPDAFNDWLVCMISTKEIRFIEGFDEYIDNDSDDFGNSGLKSHSVIRISRLAIVEEKILAGNVGVISTDRMKRIRNKLANRILD